MSYMKMICSSKNVLFGRNRVRQRRQVTFSDSEPTFIEGRRETGADIQYMTPPEVKRVASSFKGTSGEEFVSPAIEQRFGEMRSEFTEALDEIRSTLRQLAPDSKSVITSLPRNSFRCGKEGHFRKDCPMEIPSLADSPNMSTF